MMRLGIKESFTGKTSGKKTSDMILKGEELFTELTEKEFFDGLLQGLEKRGISGTQIPFTGSLGSNQKIDFLRQNIDKTVYIFSHNEKYSKYSFEIYSVFDRVVEYEDLNEEDLTEEDFNKMKEQNESIIHRVSYLMFGIYDYRVFGAKKDEQDHVQTCVGASNDAEEGVEGLDDLKGWKDMIFARGTENPFNYEDSFFYGTGHFKINSQFLMEVLRKSAWMKYAAPYWKEYVIDAFGGINGHEALVDFAKHFCRTPKYKPLPVSESFTRKTAKKSQKDVSKKADELMFNKVDKYIMFWNTVYSLFLKNKAVNVDGWSFILDVDRRVQEDNLCKIDRISWDENKDRSNVDDICNGYGLRFYASRFMDIPFELYGGPFTGKENYYYDKDGNQIRGYRLEIRMTTEPVFRNKYGYYNWFHNTDGENITLEQIPLVGFRIDLRFDVDSWVLKNGIRYSDNNHRGLSNDFRIIPDDKKGFKIVLGKRSPTNKEKVWLVSDTNPNYIFNLMFSVYRSMEDGNFLKMFLEELYRLDKKGPTYSEYIKNPKKYKNFVLVYRERLEYLKNHAPEETMYVETEKLERYLFTELIHHYVDNFPLSESMVRKISKRSADDVINDADDRILSMSSPEFIESIYNWMMEDSEHFQETSIDLYLELTSKKTDIENINPKLLRNRKMFFTLRRYQNSEDLLLFVWKIFRIGDKVFIINFKISHSIDNNKDIRDNSVLMCVECRRLGDDSSKHISLYQYFKFDDNHNFVYTPTGKGIDYESRTKYVNRNRLKTVLFNYAMNVKKFIELWDMLDTIDIRVSELNGTGQGFKRPARKSRALEIHQEIEGISKKIKRKFRIDVNEKNFYTYYYGKNLADLMLNKVFLA